MKEILEKLSSYNLFNYLFPGVIFIVIAKHFTSYNFVQDDILTDGFLYYFIGMIISRFGSIIIEPLFKKISFLKFEDYRKFITAAEKDEKIELLNNTYRSITSMIILLFFLKGYSFLEERLTITNNTTYYILGGLLFIMFLFSYRKQTNYIIKRIQAKS